jgi:hypothetical protein
MRRLFVLVVMVCVLSLEGFGQLSKGGGAGLGRSEPKLDTLGLLSKQLVQLAEQSKASSEAVEALTRQITCLTWVLVIVGIVQIAISLWTLFKPSQKAGSVFPRHVQPNANNANSPPSSVGTETVTHKHRRRRRGGHDRMHRTN